MQSSDLEIIRLVVGPIYTNCYILISDSEAAVIDPGGEAEKIISEIRKINKKVRFIINTHFHFDHTLCNSEVKKETGAEILIHENESSFLDFTPDKYLKDDEEIKVGRCNLKVILTPGHSEGGICLLEKNNIFTGDTLFFNSYGRTDLPGGSEEKMQESLKLLKKIIKVGMNVYPGHGEIYKERGEK